MKRFSAASRISVGITCLTLSLILAAQGLGVIPNPNEATLKNRKQVCESLAIQCSLAAQHGEFKDIEAAAGFIAERNPDIVSMALCRIAGEVLVKVGDHD